MFRRYDYDRDSGDWMAWVSITVLAVIVFIIYLISVLATHLLLHYLNQYLLDDKLDEDDNQILLWSAVVWALVGLGLLVLPLLEGDVLADPHGLEVLLWLLGQVAVFGGYGLLVGFGVIWWLWYWQVDHSMSGTEPVKQLSLTPAKTLVIDQPTTSANGSGNGAVPVGFEWYREGVVLGEEV